MYCTVQAHLMTVVLPRSCLWSALATHWIEQFPVVLALCSRLPAGGPHDEPPSVHCAPLSLRNSACPAVAFFQPLSTSGVNGRCAGVCRGVTAGRPIILADHMTASGRCPPPVSSCRVGGGLVGDGGWVCARPAACDPLPSSPGRSSWPSLRQERGSTPPRESMAARSRPSLPPSYPPRPKLVSVLS